MSRRIVRTRGEKEIKRASKKISRASNSVPKHTMRSATASPMLAVSLPIPHRGQ